jgi:hypothetical protein
MKKLYGRTLITGFSVFLALVLGACSLFQQDGNSSKQSSSSSVTSSSSSSAGTVVTNIIYVSAAGNDTNAGTWYNAPVKTVQYAVHLALSNSISNIYVQSGTYEGDCGLTNTNSVQFPANNMALFGGWDVNFTAQAGRSVFNAASMTYSVFYFENVTNITVDRIDVINGNGGGFYIYNSENIRIFNSVISNCHTSRGGGIFVYSATAFVTNCRILKNSVAQSGVSYGGGVFVQYATCAFSGCDISYNTSDNTTGGGGYYTYFSTSYLTNVTVTYNTNYGIRVASMTTMYSNNLAVNNNTPGNIY